jgi:hypothetical protein
MKVPGLLTLQMTSFSQNLDVTTSATPFNGPESWVAMFLNRKLTNKRENI